MPLTHRPMVLLILDGWGYRDDTAHNAIASAQTPNWDKLWHQYPHCLLDCAGHQVGLPDQQMGNSEVGHLHIGAGRVIEQDLVRINHAIQNRTFNSNNTFTEAFHAAKKNDSTLHVMGLVSPGGVHSHEDHIIALTKLAATKGIKKLAIHAFLDGRDTPPKSAASSLQKLSKACQENTGHIATLAGRFYAMDRDKRWDRTSQVYEMLTQGKAAFHADSVEEALASAYQRNETDEFVRPTRIGNQASTIENNDVVIFMNFRADRARQLSQALSMTDFEGFERHKLASLANFITLTQYSTDLTPEVAFPPISLANGLGETFAKHDLKQLRIAETEKYAHVTFFFNGGREAPFNGEERILIPSPKVTTYDLQPEMSASEVTSKIVDAISKQEVDVIVANFANADMVGHTGDFNATKKAIQCLDRCLGNIYQALQAVEGEMLITADHGNAETMYDTQHNHALTSHTKNAVPLLYVGRTATAIKPQGSLIDIAPTLLDLLALPIPNEMTGTALFSLDA